MLFVWYRYGSGMVLVWYWFGIGMVFVRNWYATGILLVWKMYGGGMIFGRYGIILVLLCVGMCGWYRYGNGFAWYCIGMLLV